MKKGFTLVELLVVIAIIGVLALLVVPSVGSINNTINERLYNDKEEHIESAAELFASNHEDIFFGYDEAEITVGDLIKNNYLEIDTKNNSGNCQGYDEGCVTDPRTNNVLNDQPITLKKGTMGIIAELAKSNDDKDNKSEPFINKVCKKIGGSEYIAYTATGQNNGIPTRERCACIGNDNKIYGQDSTSTLISDIVLVRYNGGKLEFTKSNPISVDACVISGGGGTTNWLKYGDSEPNWRVLGVYRVDGELSVKIVTNETIN